MASLTNSNSEFRNGRSEVEAGTDSNGYAQPHMLGLVEVAGILRVQPERVQALSQTYAESLGPAASRPIPQYTHTDLAALINAQRFEIEASKAQPQPSELQSEMDDATPSDPRNVDTQEGYVPSQFDAYRPQHEVGSSEVVNGMLPEDVTPDIRLNSVDGSANNDLQFARPTTATNVEDEPYSSARLPTANLTASANQTSDAPTSDAPTPNVTAAPAPLEHSTPLERSTPLAADKMLGEMLSTVATSQQSVLNVQDSIREMLNVIAQDNFNLKHENRKLRERMLELERVIAEHQRREETRKEMLESRMRAVEGTLSALQQQLAQLVQLQRQRIRKNWFK